MFPNQRKRITAYLRFLLPQLVLVFFARQAVAQLVEFDHINRNDGLPNNTVNAILQDRYGFMWFGTRNAMVRYDGYNFKAYNYSSTDSTSLNDDYIRCLLETKAGDLFIGLRFKGFCKYNRSQENFTRYNTANSALSDDNIVTMMQDSKGHIWIGTLSGFDRFDPVANTLKHYSLPSYSLPDQQRGAYVSSIVEDKAGMLWIFGVGNKLLKFDPRTELFLNNITITQNQESLVLLNRGGVLLLTEDNEIWIGTERDGLFLYTIATGSLKQYTSARGMSETNMISSLFMDSGGILWVGTDGNALFRYHAHRDEFEHISNDPMNPKSLNGNAVFSIYETKPDIIWIGTYAGGLNIYKKYAKKFQLIDDKGKPGYRLSNKFVIALEDAGNDKVWIGTDGGGLNLLDTRTGKIMVYSKSNSALKTNIPKSLLLDRNGKLWIGSYGSGLSLFDPATGKVKQFTVGSSKKSANTIPHYNIWSLAEDKDGKIWIGTLDEGLDVYDPHTGHFKNYPYNNKANGLPDSRVQVVMVDSKNRVWLGTKDGLCYYDRAGDRFVPFTLAHTANVSKSINNIKSIYEDYRGNIWFGSEAAGLCQITNIEKKEYRLYTQKDGLPGNSIFGIVQDFEGYFWLSTDNGLSRFDDLKKTFSNFDVNDGLQNNEFEVGAFLKLKHGNMLFGGIDGLNYVVPGNIHINARLPEVRITGLSLFNKSLDLGDTYNEHTILKEPVYLLKQIDLLYDENDFTFEFAALDYTAPLQNKYAYMLEGVDRDWVYVDAHKRFASYTNIEPGTYTFRVKASNNDGYWNNTGTSIVLIISPPWWETWWFRTLAVIFSMSILFGVYYVRTRQVIRNTIRLEKEVKLRTAELSELNVYLQSRNLEIEKAKDLLEKNNYLLSENNEQITQQQQEIINQKNVLEHKNRELNKLNATKDKFFSIIAHDIKNPVNAIKVLSDQVYDHIDDLTVLERNEMLEHLKKSSSGLYSLAINLLDWARSQKGDIEADIKETNVRNVVEECVLLVNSQATAKNILLVNDCASHINVLADKNMLLTIVRNLISNAIKFAPKGSTVRISLRELDKNFIGIEVIDAGPGLDEEQILKLTDMSGELYQSKQTDYGTGLGLMLVKEFTLINNGYIEVDSETDFGTTITIALIKGVGETIPNVPVSFLDQSFDGERPPLLNASYANLRVLIIDDDEALRFHLMHTLKHYFVLADAPDAHQALKLMETWLPDIIICDLNMPRMNGFELCEKVKSNPLTSHITCIVITGQTGPEIELRSLKSGADEYIAKPFNDLILLKRIENLIARKTELQNRFQKADNAAELILDNPLNQEFMNKLINIIHESLTNPEINAEFLCRAIGMSRTLLYDKVKSMTGLSVNEFIRTIRLKKSLELLRQRKVSIAQVAFDVGFNSPSYFTRSFTKQFGMSPSEYQDGVEV